MLLTGCGGGVSTPTLPAGPAMSPGSLGASTASEATSTLGDAESNARRGVSQTPCGTPPIRGLQVTATSLTLTSANLTSQFTACTQDQGRYDITVSPAGVVSVPSSVTPSAGTVGIKSAIIAVTALESGNATITVTDKKGTSATVLVTVTLGKLYVAERYSSGDVKVFDTSDLARAPTTIGPLAGPEGIALAVDPAAGRLYVSEDFSGDVRVYNTVNGQYQCVTTITGFNLPSGVAVDPAAERLYVTELGDVKVYSTAHGRYQYLSTLGAAVGVTDPGGLAVDSTDAKLYVAQGTNNVEVFNTANLSQAPITIVGLSQPGGVAIDAPAGKVYITENDIGDVRVYSTRNYRYLGTIAPGLVQPFGDALDPVAHKLYVVEYRGDVKIYDTENPWRTPTTIGGLTDAWALAVTP
jgi:DNA-binding beta-propeller fold protein YncE